MSGTEKRSTSDVVFQDEVGDSGTSESVVTPDGDQVAPRLGRRRLLLGGGYALVVVALLVVIGLLAAQRYTGLPFHPETKSHALDAARVDAVRAADDSAITLLSYDYHTVDDELKKARENLTGSFLDDYTKLTTTVVAPAARDQTIATKAVVVGSAVVSAELTRVVTLLFINQTTTTKTAPEPSQSGSRVTLTMDKVGDRWMVSALTPV